MSLIFRVFLTKKRFYSCSSSSNILRIAFNGPSTFTDNIRHKTLVPLSSTIRRNNSTATNINPISKNVKSMESDERQTIYKATLAQHIRNIKFISLFTSLLGIVSQPFMYVKVLSGTTAPSVSLSICGILYIFTFGSPILIHLITKTYIVNIDYIPKNDKYIATVYNFFAMKRKIEFTPADITIPTVLGVFTTCAIKQDNVFIDANQFLDQNHYIKIMGYDKPFKLMDDDHDKKE